MRESVPYEAVRAGDVIEAGGQLGVLLSANEGQDGARTIEAWGADGMPRRLERLRGATSGLLGRVGKRRRPTLEGLHDLTRQQVS